MNWPLFINKICLPVKQFVLLLLLFQPFLVCFTQKSNFKHIGIEDGLSQLTVNKIYQDSQGYLWFGTQDGLNRYDAYDFLHFKTDPGNSNSLSHSWIWDIFEDSKKNLWVGTWSGLNKISPDRSKIKQYFPDPDDPGSIRGDRPVSALEAPSGNLWIGTWGGGLNLYHPENDSFSCYSSTLNADENLPGDYIREIFLDKNETLWIGTWAGLWKAKINSPEKPVFSPVNLDSTIDIRNVRITSISQDFEKNIWIGTIGLGVFQLDKEGNILNSYDVSSGLVSDNITDIYPDSKGQMWIGSANSGISVYNPKTSKFKTIIHDPENPESLSENNIGSIYRDKSGLMWVGSRGLSIYKDFQLQFNQNEGFNTENKYTDQISNISSIAQDNYGNLWLGTTGHGVFKLGNDNHEHAEWINSQLSALQNLNVSSITTDPRNNIWIGTRGNGYVRLSPEKKEFLNVIYHPTRPESYGINFINGLVYTEPSSIYFATYDRGLIQYDIIKKTYQKFAFIEGDTASFPANYLLRIFKDSQSKLWICSWGAGIICFDPSNQSWETFSYKTGDPESLSDNIPHCVCETNKNGNRKIWIGTRKGLSCLELNDNPDKKFINYYPSDGLPGSIVNSIIEDKNGLLWISTNSGICSFDPDSLKFRNFDENDGLQGKEFNAGAGLKLKDGRIVFGGVNGINIFYPDSIKERKYLPDITINSFKVFDTEIPLDPGLQKIELGYRENFFSMEFSALDYSKPLKNKYRYKLDGVDRDWVNAEKRRYASYTDISPGDYTFRVMGTNSDGLWSDKIASLEIKINPPYWQRWWFRILIGLIILSLIYLFFNYRINKIKEIERLRVRIASDLHDDIGSSLTHITIHSQLIRENPDPSKLKSSVDKIGELSREIISTMSDIVWSIDARNDNLNNMLDRMRDYAYNSLQEKDISVDFHQKGVDKNKNMDILYRQNIFSIFKEVINNILKHSGASAVKIRLINSEKTFTMSIADNGKGFDNTQISRGNGLRNMKMRARRIGGSIEITSTKGTEILLKTKNL